MKVIKNICYSDIGHKNQMLDIFLPESDSFSVFIYFHGGGIEEGDKSDCEHVAKYLTEHNVAFVSANYRMYPSARYPEFIMDAAAAVAWVYTNINTYGKCDKIYVGGSSAGGYLSMMLCFDKKYLAPYGIAPTDLSGFVHDAGQPTAHFNVLREQGIDSRRVILDETAPLFHVGKEPSYPPMLFIISDDDMQNRYEQTQLMLSTLKHFEYENVSLKMMHGTHCHYFDENDENGDSVLGKIIFDFIENM